MKYLYEVESSSKEGEGPVYRSTMMREADRPLHCDPENNATTLYELLKHSASEFADQPVFGFRDILETYAEKKMCGGEEKTFTFHQLSDYRWMTFGEFDETLVLLSSALHHIGIRAQDKVTFYAPSTCKWISLAYGKPLPLR